uniref:PK_Tyr_Ser-Thr domain-containing protein n=1 Tax=Panagrellus redivivus TaxID=6233 RepID=A0A7E4WBD2_PANRE
MKTHLRRHDLEAGLYLLVEMTLGKLPWEGTPPDMMGSAKRSAITSQSLFSKCPPQYATLYTIVSCLGDNDKIDYGQLYSKLEDAWKSTGVGDIAAAYDWEAHMKPLEEQ